MKGIYLTISILCSFPVVGQAVEQPKDTVLVVGASGRTGAALAEAAASRYEIRATSRRTRDASPREPYDWRVMDARDEQSVRAVMSGVRYVVTAMGARNFEGDNAPVFVDYLGVANLVDAAVAAKVDHFVLVSSAGAGIHQEHESNARMGYIRYWKTLGEQHLKASGLDYTIIGPGGLTDKPAGAVGLKLFDRAGYRRAATARGDVARVAIDALHLGDADNKSFALVNNSAVPVNQWVGQLRELPRDVATDGVESLSFMSGYWRSDSDGEVSEEVWLPAESGTLFGVSRGQRDGADRVTFEFMRIIAGARGVSLLAQPGGSAPTRFKLTDLKPGFAVFSRSADDFPTTIIYSRRGDELTARVLGRRETGPQTLRWSWMATSLTPSDG